MERLVEQGGGNKSNLSCQVRIVKITKIITKTIMIIIEITKIIIKTVMIIIEITKIIIKTIMIIIEITKIIKRINPISALTGLS